MSDRIIPLLIISLLLLIIDFYIFNAVKSISKETSARRVTLFSFIWWGYSILLILGVFSAIFLNLFLSLRAVILVAFFLTFVTKLFFILFLFVDDIRRGITWVIRKVSPAKDPELKVNTVSAPITRSEFLVKAGIVVAAVPLASLTWGIAKGGYDYQVKRQTLILPNLPKAFEGIKLGQISDIHSGSFYNKKAVARGVDILLAEKPDFIFFTGDLVNDMATEMKDYQDIFSKVKAPLGVFSVLGNHDYGDYHFGREASPAKAKNLADVKKIHQLMGYDLLLNENRRLRVDGEEIAILGVENWGAGRFMKYGKLDLAIQNTDDAPVKLLMSHDPSHWRAQVLNHPDIDVMFSGHTHGMQFGVRTKEYQWSPIEYIYKEWAGLYKEKQQQLYVNVGYGFLGYPGRVGVLPEITIFELKRA
ncbi:metallophosphoesterase [Arcticibacter eurypsychrophilus]|uniref:metallophosphoesterase n=1 Tax=Arcticibacter eurypsychrophilus TaxID=1434752 RepID=UPI00084D673D|nr:metallophosphoesterase [Arcticibacter eurypsychrophilus]